MSNHDDDDEFPAEPVSAYPATVAEQQEYATANALTLFEVAQRLALALAVHRARRVMRVV